MDRFLGNVAVVTGASSGIGKAICIEFVKRCLTTVGLARSVEKLQALEKFLSDNKETYPGRFSFIVCDLTKENEIQDAFAKIKQSIGVIQVLVNNAGVTIREPLNAVKEEHYDKVFDTNVKALLLCSKEAIQSMIDNSVMGHIVNINSVAGLQLYEYAVRTGSTMYAASKHAAKVFSNALRQELLWARKHIKITEINPGVVKTDMTAEYMKSNSLNEYEYLTVEDVVAAVIYALETSPRVMVSDMTVKSIFDRF